MLDMKKKRTQFRYYVRTTPRIKGAAEGLRDKLRKCEPYGSRRKKLTYEATINAAWLWLDSLDAEELAAHLGPYIEEFERMWPIWSKEGEDDPVADDDPPPIVGMGRRKPLTGPPIVIDRRVDEDPELPPSPGRKRKPR